MVRSLLNRIRGIVGLVEISKLGIANAGGNAISALFWFYMASVMGPEEYGEIGYLMAIAGIAAVFCMFGSGSMLIVYTAKNYNIIWPAVLSSIGSSIIASIVLLIMLEKPVLTAYLIGYVIFNLGISNLLGRKMYKRYSITFVLQKICLVGLAVPLYHIMGPLGVILGAGLSMSIFGVEIISILKKTPISFSGFRKKIGFGISEYMNSLTRTFGGQLDKIIIAPLLGFELLGNYHLGIQVVSLLSILPNATMQYTLSQDATGSNMSMLRKVIAIISIMLAVVGILTAPFLIPVIFPEFTDAVIPVQIMCISLIPRTISTMYASKFLGMEKNKIVFTATVIFLVVQIPLIYMLGEAFNIAGVALALLIADVCYAGFFLIIHKKERARK